MTRNQILVANLGSTSFKFRLFEMPAERVLARGGFERIGAPLSTWKIHRGGEPAEEGKAALPNHEAAIRLTQEKLGGFDHVAAVGFKPVAAKGISGTQYMDDRVLAAMEELNELFPAHNPPYIAGVRAFRAACPGIPCIGTFETAFYDHLPPQHRRFPIPLAWEREFGIQRTGFHGASHRFIAERCAELKSRNDLRVISIHLGGSSSMAAIRHGVAVTSSWGMTAQSGLPHNNRAGDFDCFAMFYLAKKIGWEAVEQGLSSQAGLKGMSGLASGDMRDIREAAAAGNADAETAIGVFAASIRKYLGQFLVELDGADIIAFTGGIGENDPALRARVCAGLTFCGLELDADANAAARGEALLSTPSSRIEVWVIPANEEIIIARNAWNLLSPNTTNQS